MSDSPADRVGRTQRLAAMAQARVRQVESAVASASAHVERARTKRAELGQYLGEYGQALGGQYLDAAALGNRCAFVAKLVEACSQQDAVVAEAVRRLDQARAGLVAQKHDHARYNALHAAADADAQAQRKRQEQRDADEAATVQWQRRS